jgi:hypothetical protein
VPDEDIRIGRLFRDLCLRREPLEAPRHALAVDVRHLGVEIDLQPSDLDDGLGVARDRRTMAWIRATSSSLWKGLVI